MTPLEATASIPGVVAIFVGIAEVRFSDTRTAKIRRLAPVILALALVIVFFLLERFIDITAPQMLWWAGGMTVLSLIVGLSGVLISYTRKSSSILMAVAGFMLAYYWAFLSLPRP